MDAHEFQQHVETYMDGGYLCNVLAEVAEVCALKADHIESNWQDDDLAETWRVAAAQIEKLAANLSFPLAP